MVAAPEELEQRLYRESRGAFYRRFIERLEKKSAESSLYGVIRLLAKRPIELDIAGATSDLAALLSELAGPYVTSLRTREIHLDLTAFLAGNATLELRQALDRLGAASRAAGAALEDHPLRNRLLEVRGDANAAPHIWAGIGTCIGPAVEPLQIVGVLSADEKVLIQHLNREFLGLLSAFDQLWLPLFSFVERYMAEKCHLLWAGLATFELDFRRYAALLAEAGRQLCELQLDDALTSARAAGAAGPDECLPLLLAGHLLYQLGRREEALAAFEKAASLPLPYINLSAIKLFWTGRCLYELARYEEAIPIFAALIALPKQRVDARFYMEGEFRLARAHLLTGNADQGSKLLVDAIFDGYTDIAGLIDDPALGGVRHHPAFSATLRSATFLRALCHAAGIHGPGSTYFARSAAPFKLASSAWLSLGEHEDLVFFFDASRTGNGRFGLCLTNQSLTFCGLSGRPQRCPLEQLRSLELGPTGLELNAKMLITDQIFDRLDALHQLLTLVFKIFAS